MRHYLGANAVADWVARYQAKKIHESDRTGFEIMMLVVCSVFVLFATVKAVNWVDGLAVAHVRTQESQIGWIGQELIKISKLKRDISNRPERCTDLSRTLELVREHEVARHRVTKTILRDSAGSQYRGVEEVFPEKIRSIDCGTLIL